MADVTWVKFLTPYKVAVIALIMVYCDGWISSGSKVKIMTGILRFIDDGDSYRELELDSHSLIDCDLSYLEKYLNNAISADLNHTVFELVMERLHAIRSLDDFQDFMNSVSYYVTKNGRESPSLAVGSRAPILLNDTSILGSFCRKCYLEFDRLGFDDVSSLYEAVNSFVNGSSDQQPAIYMSSENLQVLLNFQITQFEKHAGTLPDDLRTLLNRWIDTNGDLPASSFFVLYLDAFQSRDYQQAFENLRKFYDHSMNNKGRSHYQYALFTQATLQAEFNCIQEALRSAEEALAVAREHKDIECLNYVLSWLCSFLQSRPDIPVPESFSRQDHIIQFLKNKTRESQPALFLSAHQLEASYLLAHGAPLSLIFETLTKASYIIAFGGEGGNMIPTSSACTQFVLQSTVWERSGVSALRDIYLDLALGLGSSTTTMQGAVRKSQSLFDSGQINRAYEVLNPFETDRKWRSHRLLLDLQLALNRNQLFQARQIYSRLQTMNITDSDVKDEVQYRGFVLGSLCGDGTVVKQITNKFDLEETISSDWMPRLRDMLLYARLAGEYEPHLVYTCVLRALMIADRMNLVPFILEAQVILADVIRRMGQYKTSISLVDSILPKLYETGQLKVTAEAYIVLADSSIGLIDTEPQYLDRKLLHRIVDYLDCSARLYEKLECFSKMVEICDRQLHIAQLLGDQGFRQAVENIRNTLTLRLKREEVYEVMT